MVPGLLGKKIGMTQIFLENGNKMPVTVLEAGPCFVQAVKVDKKDGYNAVQLGFCETKDKKINKPQREDLKKKDLKPMKFVREIRCGETPGVKTGDKVTNKIFQKGDLLDIVGRTKGKGFQGGMKRHNWSGGRATHGSKTHRAPGSIGASSYPSRVFRGQNMPGQMGNVMTTVQHIEVVEVNYENNTIVVKGAVPGADGTYLVMKYARKRTLAPREVEPEPKEAEEDVQIETVAKEDVKQEKKTGDGKKEDKIEGRK